MSEVFEKELAALDKVTGIHIDEDPSAETYSIFVSTRWRTVARTWSMPEKVRLGLWEWIYLYSTAYYWFIRLCS